MPTKCRSRRRRPRAGRSRLQAALQLHASRLCRPPTWNLDQGPCRLDRFRARLRMANSTSSNIPKPSRNVPAISPLLEVSFHADGGEGARATRPVRVQPRGRASYHELLLAPCAASSAMTSQPAGCVEAARLCVSPHDTHPRTSNAADEGQTQPPHPPPGRRRSLQILTARLSAATGTRHIIGQKVYGRAR